VEIIPFRSEFQSEVLELILGIQRGEYSIDITAEQQPDLRTIPDFYQVAAGNFWVALCEGRVVGTIALLDIGHGQGALRKMFVSNDYRGARHGTASRLLTSLLDWAGAHEFREIFLGTTEKYLAAHRFYAKNGFSEILESSLPPAFPIMSVDTRFFRRAVGPLSQ
jgi:N-acetylglutamate synthase-like GNAT family acetyltransferase